MMRTDTGELKSSGKRHKCYNWEKMGIISQALHIAKGCDREAERIHWPKESWAGLPKHGEQAWVKEHGSLA